ncbi:hypothetical protein HIM_09725 [Hirsutella minnesotensis 3608]|uniref:LysM domain-containing protein n=1 Tax=Hirsutella minnesotensis 3608 TaxID=1043627 RepID=A0A0F7ZL01_9HYPO|nr:hypothetical protein HIM_09725 [Hirsutella minnesotensis 3608]
MTRSLLRHIYLALIGTAITASTKSIDPPAATQPGSAANCNRWHVVESGSSCDGVERQYHISHSQFLSWNPAVSEDCITNFWPKYAYCVGVGEIIPSATRKDVTSTTRASTETLHGKPPAPTFAGTPSNCITWHVVRSGETCSLIAEFWAIPEDTFFQLNPDVSRDCTTNFWTGYAYCIKLGPSINKTLPTSRTTTTKGEVTSTAVEPYSVRYPSSTWTVGKVDPVVSAWPPTRTQAGQPDFCTDWHRVREGERCDDIISKYTTWMRPADFFAWNPELGADCSGLQIDYYVCVEIRPQTILTIELPAAANFTLPPYVSWTPPPLPTVDSSFTPTPSHGPMPSDCIDFYKARPSNSCDDILASYGGVTKDQFFEWNPVLSRNCDAVRADNYYCVRLPADDKSWQPPTTTEKPPTTLGNSASNCVAWYQTFDDDTCDLIVSMFGSFSDQEFKAWNPSLKQDCSGLTFDTWYCVAVPGSPTTRTNPLASETSLFPGLDEPSSSHPEPTEKEKLPSSPSLTSSRTEPVVSTPQPIQGEMAPGCRRFYYVKPGDGCWQISHDAGIELDRFYRLNPAVGPNCQSMWANIYVCVGTSGPVVTFSGTPPKPT